MAPKKITTTTCLMTLILAWPCTPAAAREPPTLASLAGTWAVDCSLAPSPTNTYTRIEPIDDRVAKFDVTYRGLWAPEMTATSREPADGDKVTIDIDAEGMPPYRGVLLTDGDHMRVWEMVDRTTGRATVTEGIVVSMRTVTHELSRCERTTS